MSKYLRSYILGSLILLVLLSGVAAAEEVGISIDQAIGLAQDENLQLTIAGLQMENAKLDYQKNKLTNLATNSKVIELQGELALVNAQENYRQAKNGVIIDIVSQYLQLIQLNKGIIIAENEVELQKRKLQEVEAQVEVGYKGTLELFDQQREYQSAVNDLEKTQDDYQQKLKTLKMSISVDSNAKIRLPVLGVPQPWEVSEEESIETALANDATLALQTRQIELAEANLNRARVADTPKLDMQKLENDLELARYNYTLSTHNVETSVQQQYYSYKQAIKSLDIALQSKEQAEKNLNIITEQESAGLVTKNNVLEARVSLLRAEQGYLLAIINYYINQLQLKQAMGIELGVNINVQNVQ